MNGGLNDAEYRAALARIKKQQRDRLGVLGEIGLHGLGAAAGYAASASVANAFGATTLLGSSWLGGLLGGLFVTTTPVGWVVGSTVAGAAAASLVARLIRSGRDSDGQRRMMVATLKQRLAQRQQEEEQHPGPASRTAELENVLKILVQRGRINRELSDAVLLAVRQGHMTVEYALEAIGAL